MLSKLHSCQQYSFIYIPVIFQSIINLRLQLSLYQFFACFNKCWFFSGLLALFYPLTIWSLLHRDTHTHTYTHTHAHSHTHIHTHTHTHTTYSFDEALKANLNFKPTVQNSDKCTGSHKQYKTVRTEHRTLGNLCYLVSYFSKQVSGV